MLTQPGIGTVRRVARQPSGTPSPARGLDADSRRWLEELGDLATQAADDALTMVLAKLDAFRGASRFTTWAYKFVLLEAGVKARRRAWHGREVVLDAPLDARGRVRQPAPSRPG